MGYRKIYLAIDCRNDEEAQKIQKIAEDLSMIFTLSATDIIGIYPSVKNNASLIKTTIKSLSKDGLKGLSKVIPYLMSNFKRS